MAQVIYSDAALADLERIIELLLESSAESAPKALDQARNAIAVLSAHPRIGRRVRGPQRELVITYGESGYLALYRFEPTLDIVHVLRIRHQREAGYRD